MNVQVPEVFRPVHITLDSKHEVDTFMSLLKKLCDASSSQSMGTGLPHSERHLVRTLHDNIHLGMKNER